MPVRWANSARQDIADILLYFNDIQEKAVGQALVDRLLATVDLLGQFPNSGRPGRVQGTRELIIPDQPYFLVYTVTDHVQIARVLHMRRKWP